MSRKKFRRVQIDRDHVFKRLIQALLFLHVARKIHSSKKSLRVLLLRFFGKGKQLDRALEIGGGTAMMRGSVQKRAKQFISSDIEHTDKSDLVCDALQLPIASFSSIDLVVAFEVLEHLPDTNGFFEEIVRVLRGNGFVALSLPFLYGQHDYKDFYRWTEQDLQKLFRTHGLDIKLLKKRGRAFYSIVTLINNYLHQTFSGRSNNWRAHGVPKKVRLALMTIILLPFMLCSWIAFFLDALIDRDSPNPSGFVVVGQKLE